MELLTVKGIIKKIVREEVYCVCNELLEEVDSSSLAMLEVQYDHYEWLQENGYKFRNSDDGCQWDYDHPESNFTDSYYFDNLDECIDDLLMTEQVDIPYYDTINYWLVSDWFSVSVDGCMDYKGLNIWAQCTYSLEDDPRLLAYAQQFAKDCPSLMQT